MPERENKISEKKPGDTSVIFLIGFMGSGKSYWGHKWAQIANYDFTDIDAIVELEELQTIGEIFSERGEEYFRNLETEVLKREGIKKNSIISTGGGTPCFNDNISWMNDNGTTVYLRSHPDFILKRLAGEREKRPLIKHLQEEELLFYITEKIKEREHFYNRATMILDVDTLPENFIPVFLKR